MTGELVRDTRFKTFDGTISLIAKHQRPDRFVHLESPAPTVYRIPRGGGYACAATSFGQGSLVQEMTCFNRFLEFNATELTLRLEAGVTLVDLLEWALPRGFYFPVLPGYPLITLGGCVAADVHGKNPYKDGTFSNWVKQITLFHPKKGYQTCSREQHPDIFELTCGGFGLTGVIIDITLQMTALPAPAFRLHRKTLDSLGAAQDQLSACESEIAYSWHDGAPGPNFGKGILYTGTWAEGPAPLRPLEFYKLTADSRGTLPFSAWNALTARAANSVRRLSTRYGKDHHETSILNASFPLASNIYFHTLFGRRGFREAQFLVPGSSTGRCLENMSALICDLRAPTIMLSMKRFRGDQQSLSMSGRGYILTVNCYRNEKTENFMRQLDTLMMKTGAQPNLSKDSRLPRNVAESCIANFTKFKERLFDYDEDRLMRSELSSRLGLL